MNAPTPLPDASSSPHPGWIKAVTERAAHLKYGSILITIHDSRVTQIDVLEKVRMLHGQPAPKGDDGSLS
jgi:hypothetical protein